MVSKEYECWRREIVELYKVGGGKEGMLDDMKNGLGWERLGKWLMGEKSVLVVVRGVMGNL